jgi:D-aspartate ligase
MNIQKSSILIPDECDKPLGYYAIRCLKEARPDLEINIMVSSDRQKANNSWLVFYQHSKYVDRLHFSQHKMDSVDYLQDVIQIIKERAIELILPASEMGFKFASKFRSQLSEHCFLVALPSDNSLEIAFDKGKLGEFLQEHEISTPKTVSVTEFQQGAKLNYPILFKPVAGSGGKDIQQFDRPAEVKLPANYDAAENNYVVQEYITGHDIDCNVLCSEGKILAHTVQQPLGMESGFSPKIDKLKFVHDDTVVGLVRQAMSKLKWSGITHLDLRYCAKTGKLYIIEMNPRFWQSLMGSLIAGVNFPHLLYLLSTNVDFDLVDYQDKYYAKVPRVIKDILSFSLNYSLKDTNIKYFLTDPLGLFQFYKHQLLREKT